MLVSMSYTSASIEISRFTCDPNEISKATGKTPTQVILKGQPLRYWNKVLEKMVGSGRPADHSRWSIQLKHFGNANFNEAVSQLLAGFNIVGLKRLLGVGETSASVSLACESEEIGEVIELSAQTIEAVAEAQASIDFDLYWLGEQTPTEEAATSADFWPSLKVSFHAHMGEHTWIFKGGWKQVGDEFPSLEDASFEFLRKFPQEHLSAIDVEFYAAGTQTPIVVLPSTIVQKLKGPVQIKFLGPLIEDSTHDGRISSEV